MQGTEIVAAWTAWLDSDEGKRAASISDSRDLYNRLMDAFLAGVKTAEARQPTTYYRRRYNCLPRNSNCATSQRPL